MRVAKVVAALAGMSLVGCVDEPSVGSTEQGLTGVQVLDAWAAQFVARGASAPENALRTQVRIAIVQFAMFDAVNAALAGPYEGFASNPTSEVGASADAAAARAGYIVALNEFPTQTTAVTTFYNNLLAGISDTPENIAAGLAVGEVAADAVLDARANDGRNAADQTGYNPCTGPGCWVPTPGGTALPQTPFLSQVTPFGWEDPSRFRPIAPPKLTSETYTRDYIEIKDVGSQTNTSRTAEQSATATFWSGSASATWIANVRSLAQAMDPLSAARFEALGVASAMNGLLAAWDSKFHYNYWRPVTAIRAGASDGNDETDGDPTWLPFIVTPSHPEYVAAHTAVGGATTGFYEVYFGTSDFAFDFRGAGNLVRHYDSIPQVREEEGNARVWGGMHWRNSTEIGSRVGKRLGHYTATHLLKDRSEFAPLIAGTELYDIYADDCSVFIECQMILLSQRAPSNGVLPTDYSELAP
jgi:hypothetical protein